jgi:hypothetical protein
MVTVDGSIVAGTVSGGVSVDGTRVGVGVTKVRNLQARIKKTPANRGARRLNFIFTSGDR